jgi:DNA invertase Pin-like site-specific DNA recombinase
MRTVYICSPYSGDTKRNKQYARELTAHAIQLGIELNKEIKNQSEIARRLNIDVSTVNRMLKPGFIPFRTKAKYFSDIERSSEWFLTI